MNAFDARLGRRSLLAGIAALFAARFAAARSHITRARVSLITDEMGANQHFAVAWATDQGRVGLVDLRNVPESGKEFALLTAPELRGYASELAENKLKVSLLRTSLLKFAWPAIKPADTAASSPAEPDEKRWARRKDDLMRALAAAAILGTDRIRIFTGARAADPAAALPQVAAAIQEFIPAAEAAKVRLVIENEPSQNIATGAELKALMNLLPSPAVGFIWDPWNALARGESDGFSLLPRNRMLAVQVKGESLEGPNSLNWRLILDSLQKENFQGPVALATERFGEAYLQQSRDMAGDLLHIVNRLD